MQRNRVWRPVVRTLRPRATHLGKSFVVKHSRKDARDLRKIIKDQVRGEFGKNIHEFDKGATEMNVFGKAEKAPFTPDWTYVDKIPAGMISDRFGQEEMRQKLVARGEEVGGSGGVEGG